MDGRIDDDDGGGGGDPLNPFFTISPRSPSNYSHSYSANFALSSPPNLLDDGDEYHSSSAARKKFNFDETSTSDFQKYQNSPKVFDRFEELSSSSDENDELFGLESKNDDVQKRLDYMMEFLDSKLSLTSSPDGSNSVLNQQKERHPLPEFIARGGGAGMFKFPTRSAVHPARPPSIELRPHPLRESQIGKFLRNVVCVDDGKQMWAGTECGLRCWDLVNMYREPMLTKWEEEEEEEDEVGDCENFEEEDTAPFVESIKTPATLCVVGDDGNRLIWSGHKDGRVRCWKMDGITNSRCAFKEGLSWQAHRGPVLSLVMTSYGMYIYIWGLTSLKILENIVFFYLQ